MTGRGIVPVCIETGGCVKLCFKPLGVQNRPGRSENMSKQPVFALFAPFVASEKHSPCNSPRFPSSMITTLP